MRKVVMWNLMTLDGRFEGPKSWDLWFHEMVWGEELERFSLDQGAAADTLLFGRITYQGMADHWTRATGPIANMMNGIRKIVFSRTLDKADWNNSRLIKTSPEKEIAKLKSESGKDMLIFGSAQLSSVLMQHKLVDEYRLCIVPVVLGDGTSLFKSMPEPLKMTLMETRPLKTGGIILFYLPKE